MLFVILAFFGMRRKKAGKIIRMGFLEQNAEMSWRFSSNGFKKENPPFSGRSSFLYVSVIIIDIVSFKKFTVAFTLWSSTFLT